MVESYPVENREKPYYGTNNKNFAFVRLLNSKHSMYACLCISPEPVSTTLTLTDNWSNTIGTLTPGGGGGVASSNFNACNRGTGSLITKGISTSVTLPFVASISVTICC